MTAVAPLSGPASTGVKKTVGARLPCYLSQAMPAAPPTANPPEPGDAGHTAPGQAPSRHAHPRPEASRSDATGNPIAEEPSISVGRLLTLRLRALRRRAVGGGTLGGAFAATLLFAAAASVAVALAGLARQDLAAAWETPGLRKLISDRAFWLNALPVLVYAYTSWEVAFRASDARFVSLLPLPGDRRWLDLLARSLTVHLPLLVPGLAYAIALATAGAPLAGGHVLGVLLGTYALSIPMCAWLHLSAGRSMLGGATPLKKLLASQVVDDDAALMLYAPAAGLALSLGASVGLDIAMRAWLWDAPRPALAIAAVALAGAAGLVFAGLGRRAATHDLPLVVARLREVESPLPYRDDGIPETTAGEGLAQLLPPPARPFFRRDLKQLRRRHRLDRILLWAFCAVALRLGLTGGYGPGAEGVADAVCLHAGFVGLLLVGGWRVHGPELGSPWLSGSLPAPRSAPLFGGVAVDLIIPGQALAWQALALVLGGHLAQAAWVAALGAGAALGLTVAARVAAAALSPERVGGAALAWRAAVVVAIVVTQWQVV